MLVITRKEGESIHIGDDVEIKIVRVKGGSIRVGVNAPASLPVRRKEVLERIAAGEVKERSDES